MSTISDITRLARKRFDCDLFALQTTGIVIEEVGDLYARCSLSSNECHQNARGVLMGGVIYTIA
ncbi:MAG: hypothetical protein KBT04_03505, partial [Bacteroidales bacterium]|nr:hypothetical protein [Candidatus Colimorpha onthohippi]